MDPNNYRFNSQNSSQYPFNYQNPNNFQDPNQFSNYQNPMNYQDPNQFSYQRPQNIPNFGLTPNFNQSSSVPNFHPYHASMMRYPSQTPPFYGYMPMVNENSPSVGVPEFPEFSTQITLGGMTAANEDTPNEEDSTPVSKKTHAAPWNQEQNLVLISGWIKYGTSSVVGRNQKGDCYWGQIAEYCNEHCSFNPPRDGPACRNRFNYMSRILNKWVGAYDNAKRSQGSGWSENDILAKAQEFFAGGKNAQFTMMEEWHALRDQPRYCSQIGRNATSGSSGSKRSHPDSDACGSNSIGSIARPMGREAAKRKGKKKSKEPALEEVDHKFDQYKQFKEKELERLDEIASVQRQMATVQREANELLKAKTRAKNMKMYMKLISEDDLDDRKKELLKVLSEELFEN